jgi:hypothetical protein
MSTITGQPSARKWLPWMSAIVGAIVVLGALWFLWAKNGAVQFGHTMELGSIATPDGSGMLRVILVEPKPVGRDALQVRLCRPGKEDSIVASLEGKYKLYELGYSDSLTLKLTIQRGTEGRRTVHIPRL